MYYYYIQKLSYDILSGAKLKVKVKYDLQQIKVGKRVGLIFFCVIFTGKFISNNILMIQGQKANFKVQ